MPYTPPAATVQIAVAANGNPSVRVLPYQGLPLPAAAEAFAPIALPGSTFPDAFAAEQYAEHLLRHAGVISQEVQVAGLVWISGGHTVVNGRRYAVRTAPLPAQGWVPLAGTRNN